MVAKGWPDLPPDLLREIAGRLHVPCDYVNFHTVCKPWRDFREPVSPTATTTNQPLLPWLVVPTESSSPLKLRCVFSKSSYRVLPPPYPPCRTIWVCSADGATVQYLTVEQLCPTLHDPITGALTDLPPFPYVRWEENPYGIIYGDGTILLYNISASPIRPRIQAVLLRPGDENWKLVRRTIHITGLRGGFSAAYHGGRIVVAAQASSCLVVQPDGGVDMLVPRPWMPGERYNMMPQYSYILESHGELLWVSVQARFTPEDHMLLVSVHTLEEEKMLWVRKEGHLLADRVLFLGSPNSFTVDASLLGGHGGCAYFVCNRMKVALGPSDQLGVFRYNFVDHKTDLIDRLPLECDIERGTWFVPNPTITPIQELIRRKLEAQILKEGEQRIAPSITSPPSSRIFHIERHYEHSFRVLVRNLPPKVKESQLQLFFRKHGKVSNTKIVYHKYNTTSENMGIVKMATMHAHEDDAVAALNELDFGGCRLDVILLNNRCRRPRRKVT